MTNTGRGNWRGKFTEHERAAIRALYAVKDKGAVFADALQQKGA